MHDIIRLSMISLMAKGPEPFLRRSERAPLPRLEDFKELERSNPSLARLLGDGAGLTEAIFREFDVMDLGFLTLPDFILGVLKLIRAPKALKKRGGWRQKGWRQRHFSFPFPCFFEAVEGNIESFEGVKSSGHPPARVQRHGRAATAGIEDLHQDLQQPLGL